MSSMAYNAAAGLGGFSVKRAELGLPNTLHAVTGRDGEQLVVMARLIGDGGLFAQVTDVAVHPDFQRRGLGFEVMTRLMAWADTNLPDRCFISLIADPGAERLYEKLGFSTRNGMARPSGSPR